MSDKVTEKTVNTRPSQKGHITLRKTAAAAAAILLSGALTVPVISFLTKKTVSSGNFTADTAAVMHYGPADTHTPKTLSENDIFPQTTDTAEPTSDSATDTCPPDTSTIPEPPPAPGPFTAPNELPESSPVSDSYFEDAVFVGNSLVVGLQKVGPLPAQFYANIGLSVFHVFSKELVTAENGDSLTALEALRQNENCSKVYLMFGINEVGWTSVNAFTAKYEELVDAVKEACPNAVIYIQTILPINEEVYLTSPEYEETITNQRILEFNQAIAEMASRKGVCLVNTAAGLCTADGVLPADATSDGIHLSKYYIDRWADYLRSHTFT